MNNRRVHEDTDSGDTDHTVRSFWDRFIDLYNHYVFELYGSM